MDTNRKKILVVDDEEGIVGFVTAGLTSAGFEVVSARDGEEGLYIAKTVNPAVMLLDIAMPRVHGFEVLRRVRVDPSLAHMKVIMTTVKNYPVDKRDAEALGADRYLVKPFGIKDLIDAVRGVLGDT